MSGNSYGVVEDIARLTEEKLARSVSAVPREPAYRRRAEAMRQVFREGNGSDQAVRTVESLLRPSVETSPRAAGTTR